MPSLLSLVIPPLTFKPTNDFTEFRRRSVDVQGSCACRTHMNLPRWAQQELRFNSNFRNMGGSAPPHQEQSTRSINRTVVEILSWNRPGHALHYICLPTQLMCESRSSRRSLYALAGCSNGAGKPSVPACHLNAGGAGSLQLLHVLTVKPQFCYSESFNAPCRGSGVHTPGGVIAGP